MHNNLSNGALVGLLILIYHIVEPRELSCKTPEGLVQIFILIVDLFNVAGILRFILKLSQNFVLSWNPLSVCVCARTCMNFNKSL